MNKKVLYFLTLSLLISGCGDEVKDPATYLESAKSYYEKEDYAKAQLEFKNALQIDSEISEAYYYLALIDEKDQNWSGMLGKLSRTVELDPANNEANLKLAKLYLLSGKLDKAKNYIDSVLKNDEGNLDAIALSGAIHLKEEDNEAALAEAEKVLAINPEHLDALSLKIAVFMAKEDFVTAENIANTALETSSDILTLNLLKLQIHAKSNNVSAIEKDYLHLLQLFPERHDFAYALAKLYVRTKRGEKALELLTSVVEQNPDQVKPKLVLVDYLFQTDMAKAETVLNKFIAEKQTSPDLYLRLANLYIKQKNFEEAKAPLNWVIEHNGKDKQGLSAKVLLAKIAVQELDNSKAKTLTEQVLAVDATHYAALLLRARLKVMEGLFGEAIPDLQGLIRDYPKSDEALVLLAQAYLKKKTPELAESNFRQALNINPSNFSAVMPVVMRMIADKEVDSAENILETALKSKPGHAGALQALAQVRLLKKDWSGTQDIANLIAKNPQGVGFSRYLEGKIAYGQGLYNQAIKKYKLALALTPSLSDALKSMLICYEALKQRDKMFVYLEEFMQNNPTNPYPMILKGELFSVAKDREKALLVFNQGSEKWPEVFQFYEAIGRIYHETNDKEKVIEIYNKGLKQIPDNIRLRMLLAGVYEENKDYENAVKQYEILVKNNSGLDLAVNNLVSLLLDHFPGQENSERAMKLAKRFENSKQPYFQDTYGWALLHNDKIDESVVIFKQVVSKMPKVAVFKYHLGLGYAKLNLEDKAISELEQAVALGEKQNNFQEKGLALHLINDLKQKKKI